MEYAVDVQGFKKGGNDFVLKELAILPLEEDSVPVVHLFKQPFSWRKLSNKYKRENLYLELCYHGLSWNSGEREYTEIGNILRDGLQDAKNIFVIGDINKKWLERFQFEVTDISDYGYLSSDQPKLVTVCTHHNGAFKATCALQNVKLMRLFYFEQIHMQWESVSDGEV